MGEDGTIPSAQSVLNILVITKEVCAKWDQESYHAPLATTQKPVIKNGVIMDAQWKDTHPSTQVSELVPITITVVITTVSVSIEILYKTNGTTAIITPVICTLPKPTIAPESEVVALLLKLVQFAAKNKLYNFFS